MLRAGEVFAGYVIERRLGSGGMGEVYLATHPRLPRRVALKLLGRDFTADPEIRARFEREAELIARLDHPNIVSVHDRGVHDDRLWISMQFIDGVDAGELDPPTLPPARAVQIVGEVAKALDYAHSMGILHRDVKPANIMVARPAPGYGERILLTDFGIGRLRDDSGALTRTGSLLATLAYAAPEQLAGAPVGPEADRYSLACALFWLLCGSTPFAADNAAAVVAGHLHYPPPRVSDRRAAVPAAVNAVLAKALAKQPADRFASCIEFASAAREAIESRADPAPPASASPGAWAPAGQAGAQGIPSTDPTLVDPLPGGYPTPQAPVSGAPGSVPPVAPSPGASPWSSVAASEVEPASAVWMRPGSPGAQGNPSSHSGDLTAIPAAPVPAASAWARQSSAPPGRVPSDSAVQGFSPGGPPVAVRSRRGRTFWVAGAAICLVIVLGVVFGIIWAAGRSGSSSATSRPRATTAGPGSLAAFFTGSQPIGQVDAQGKLITPGEPHYPTSVGTARCGATTIAMVGALSGPNAALGRNVLGGVKLMVDQFGKASPDCPIVIRQFDTTGDPGIAGQFAPQIVADPSIVAVIGPVFSGEAKVAGRSFDDAGLPFLTPATNTVLSTLGWRSFFRGLAGDGVQGAAVGRYLAGAAGYRRVCVLSDNSDYGAGLGASIISGLGAVSDPSCAVTVPMAGDPADAISKVKAAAPDAVYYAGYYVEAGSVLDRLRRAGVSAPFVSGDGSYDPAFVTAAGSEASGTVLSCPCGPVTDHFLTDYEAVNGQAAGVYAAEAYDLTAIVLRGIAAGHTSRADLLSYLKTYSGDGVARSYAWTATGELAEPRVWLYKLQ
ncbi:protein kinase domain-containing protein [Nocardia sp. NPDC004722]